MRVAAAAVIALALAAPAGAEPNPAARDRTFGGGDGFVVTKFPTHAWIRGGALQENGKIVVAGRIGSDFAVGRYHPDGRLDTTFAGVGYRREQILESGVSIAEGVVVQADEKIVVAGDAWGSPSPLSRVAVLRYTRRGSLDRTFGRNGRVVVKVFPYVPVANAQALTYGPGGKIVVVGESRGRVFALRLTRRGRIDTTFGGGDGRAVARKAAYGHSVGDALVQPDGKVLVVGSAFYEGRNAFYVMRFTAGGTLDRTFHDDGFARIWFASEYEGAADVMLYASGKILVVGYTNASSREAPVREELVAARFLPNGELDPTFGTAGKAGVPIEVRRFSLVAGLDAGERVLVASERYTSEDFVLARLKTDGGLDEAFDGDGFVAHDWTRVPGVNPPDAVIVRTKGQIVVAGETATFRSFFRSRWALAQFVGDPPE